MGNSSSRRRRSQSDVAQAESGAGAPTGHTRTASGSQYIPVTPGPLPGDTGVRVACPRCRTVLMPPAALFRCPCGQLMTYQEARTPSDGDNRDSMFVVMSGRRNQRATAPRFVVQRSGPLGRMDAEDRLRFLSQRLPPDDPYAVFLRLLLARLPVRSDGTLNLEAMDDVARQLDTEIRGAPQGLIDLLPTREYSKEAEPTGVGEKEEHKQCTICICDYEEGEIIRTLPCLHSFHQGCIDPWLKTNKSCPVCKTPIDVDQDDLLQRLLQEEAAEATAKAAPVATAGAGRQPSD